MWLDYKYISKFQVSYGPKLMVRMLECSFPLCRVDELTAVSSISCTKGYGGWGGGRGLSNW